MERPDAGGPALPQPDRASAPLVSEETVRADPVTIFDMQTPVRAVGQEPDWEVIFEDGWIVFERPGLPLVEVPLPELPDGANGVMEFDAGRMRVTLTRDGCDGPGGSLDVRIGFEDVTYVGCGGSHEGSVAQAASVSWQNLIVDYGPAIDACLSEASGKRLVRALYPREENTVGMILVDEIGRHEECGANSVSGEISFFDPVTTDQAEIWLDGPAVFARSELGLVCSSVSPQQDIEIGDGFGVLYPAGCKA
tara:strand:+ start:77004 stop:77756 length:753 start_codon:yes stop_codon:yes gene_type:complete